MDGMTYGDILQTVGTVLAVFLAVYFSKRDKKTDKQIEFHDLIKEHDAIIKALEKKVNDQSDDTYCMAHTNRINGLELRIGIAENNILNHSKEIESINEVLKDIQKDIKTILSRIKHE